MGNTEVDFGTTESYINMTTDNTDMIFSIDIF